MTFMWDVSPEEAFSGMIDEYERLVKLAVHGLFQKYVSLIETWMKTNAPWIDQTGAAREALKAEVEDLITAVAIEFGHGEEIYYGKWLENNNAGRFAIVAPALDKFFPMIMADLQGMMNGN